MNYSRQFAAMNLKISMSIQSLHIYKVPHRSLLPSLDPTEPCDSSAAKGGDRPRTPGRLLEISCWNQHSFSPKTQNYESVLWGTSMESTTAILFTSEEPRSDGLSCEQESILELLGRGSLLRHKVSVDETFHVGMHDGGTAFHVANYSNPPQHW